MTIETAEREYLSCAETAKLVRKAIAQKFPGVKFSVRSSVYSGGASIDVTWTDGPLSKDVETVTCSFSGADFDGMIDLKSYRQTWLETDGSATIAHIQGTNGSQPEYIGSRRTAGARLVHFGADFIFCNRRISDEATKREAALAWIHEHLKTDGEGQCEQFGNCWVSDVANNLVYHQRPGETFAEVFERDGWHN